MRNDCRPVGCSLVLSVTEDLLQGFHPYHQAGLVFGKCGEHLTKWRFVMTKVP